MIELLLGFLAGCCVGIAPWHWLAKKNERLAREGRTFVPDNAELAEAVVKVIEANLGVTEAVLASPTVLRRLKAQRIARAVLAVAEPMIRADERERCAKVADEHASTTTCFDACLLAESIAAAIRAR